MLLVLFLCNSMIGMFVFCWGIYFMIEMVV